MHGGEVSKRYLKEFTIAPNEIQHMVIRNSKLAGPRRSAHRYGQISTGTTPIYRMRSSKDIKENWFFTLNKSGRNTPMKLRFRLLRSTWKYAPSPPRIWRRATRTNSSINTIDGIRRPLHPAPHGVSGMNTGGAHY